MRVNPKRHWLLWACPVFAFGCVLVLLCLVGGRSELGTLVVVESGGGLANRVVRLRYEPPGSRAMAFGQFRATDTKGQLLGYLHRQRTAWSGKSIELTLTGPTNSPTCWLVEACVWEESAGTRRVFDSLLAHFRARALPEWNDRRMYHHRLGWLRSDIITNPAPLGTSAPSR